MAVLADDDGGRGPWMRFQVDRLAAWQIGSLETELLGRA